VWQVANRDPNDRRRRIDGMRSINLNLPERLLAELDARVSSNGGTRSGLITAILDHWVQSIRAPDAEAADDDGV
jgi:metal-responsive CopG/Arc/MetJ family transcriptional regulator